MSFLNPSADTLVDALKRGDDFFVFSADIEDNDPNAGSLVLPTQTQAIYVGPNSDMDKFSVVYRDPGDSQNNLVTYFSPGAPWLNRLGITTPISVDVSNARFYEQAVLTGGQRPKAELIILFKNSGNVAIPRVPKFTSGIVSVAGAGETLIGRLYCYGRKKFSFQVQTSAAAPAVTVRVEGQIMGNSLPLPNVVQTLGSQAIAAAGGSADISGTCMGYDRLVVYSTGPIAVGEGFFHLEVQD